MTVAELLVAFICAALVVMTILVGGTLGAAGLLRRPHRHQDAGDGSDRNRPDPIDHEPPPRGRAA